MKSLFTVTALPCHVLLARPMLSIKTRSLVHGRVIQVSMAW